MSIKALMPVAAVHAVQHIDPVSRNLVERKPQSVFLVTAQDYADLLAAGAVADADTNAIVRANTIGLNFLPPKPEPEPEPEPEPKEPKPPKNPKPPKELKRDAAPQPTADDDELT